MCSNCLKPSFLSKLLIVLFAVCFSTGTQEDFLEDLRIELNNNNPIKITELSCGYIHSDAALTLLCSPSNELTSIRLYGLTLKEIPFSISSLSQSLSSFELQRSGIVSLCKDFDCLTNLKHLDLAMNSLKAFPDSLSTLSLLTYLDLSENTSVSISSCLSSFKNLQYLNICENSLLAFPTCLSTLTYLTYLDLGINRFSSFPDSLSSLSLLTHLNLSENSFKSFPTCLSSYTNLQYLGFGFNVLTSFPDSLSSLTQLTHLNLKQCYLPSIPNWFTSFTSLKELMLSQNYLLGGNTNSFKEMKLLSELYVDDTLISGQVPEKLRVFSCYSSCVSSSYCSKSEFCPCNVYSPQECPQDRCGINSQQLCVDCLSLVSRNQCTGSCQWCSEKRETRECFWCDYKKNDCEYKSRCNECSGHTTSSQCVVDSDCQWCEYDYCAVKVTECEPMCNNLSQEKCESKRDCLWCSSYSTCLDLTSQCLSCDRFTSSFCPPGCDCPSGSNSTVIIVVCVVCCVVFLLLCVCLLVWIASRKRNAFQYYKLSQMPLHFDEDVGIDKLTDHPIVSRYSECCVDSLFRVSQNILSFTSLGSPLKLCSPVTVSFEMTNICGMDLVVESLFVKGFKEKHKFVFTPSSFTIDVNEKRKICVELTMNCSATLTPSQSFICCEISNTQQWCSLCGIQSQSELSSLLSCDDIELIREIGRGASGKVYLGSFKGTEVAVKMYPAFTQEDNEKEANMFSKLHSPQIVTFFGISQTLNAMIIEYCKYGSVEGLFNRKEMTDWIRLLICSDCSLGMKYLHSNGIIHRDLKPDNLLIVSFSKDENTVRAKISDFGTSRFVNQTMKMTESIGTPAYMAPEVFNNESYGKKSDVYSFGLTVWAIFSKQTPYSELAFVHTILLKVNEGYRPQLCQDCPLNDLIERCWQTNPDDRPSFEEITQHIKQRIEVR